MNCRLFYTEQVKYVGYSSCMVPRTLKSVHTIILH